MIEQILHEEKPKYGKYFLATEAPKKKKEKADVKITRRKSAFDNLSLDDSNDLPLDDMDLDGIADYDEIDDIDSFDAMSLDDVTEPDPVEINDPDAKPKVIDSVADINKKPKVTENDLDEYDGPEEIAVPDEPAPIESPDTNDDSPAPIENPEPEGNEDGELSDIDIDNMSLDDVDGPDAVEIDDPDAKPKVIDSVADINKKPRVTENDLDEYDGPEEIAAPIDDPGDGPAPIENPDANGDVPAPIADPGDGPAPIEAPSDVQVDTPTNDGEPAAIASPDGPAPIDNPDDGPAPIADPGDGPAPIEAPSDVQVDTPTNDGEPAAIENPDATGDGPAPIDNPDDGPAPIADPGDGPAPIESPDANGDGPAPIENPDANGDGPAPIADPNANNQQQGNNNQNQQPDTNFNNNNPNNNQQNGQNNQADKPGAEYDSTRKYLLFKEYMSLYNAIDNYIFKLEDNIKDDLAANQIIKTSVNKLREIKELIYDYILIKFDNNTYIQSLLFYQNLVVSVQMVFRLLSTIERKTEEE